MSAAASTTGASTSARSPPSGAAAASSGPRSWTGSGPPTRPIPRCPRCWPKRSSARRSPPPRIRGATWWPPRCASASPCPASRLPWPTTTRCAPSACPPPSSRACAITSARTPTAARTVTASSTPCGRRTAPRKAVRPFYLERPVPPAARARLTFRERVLNCVTDHDDPTGRRYAHDYPHPAGREPDRIPERRPAGRDRVREGVTASRHLVLRAAEASFLGPPEWAPSAIGARRWPAVDDQVGAQVGAVHTGFGICELEPGGSLPGHVHSFEQSFFILDGEVVLTTPEGSFLLGPDDYGFLSVGVPHAWRNDGGVTARWADMLAPQPRRHHHGDTIRVDLGHEARPVRPDLKDPRTPTFGHIAAASLSGPSPDE